MSDRPRPRSSQRRVDWWRRHWKWVVPTVLLSVVLVVGGVVLTLIAMALSLVRGSSVYQRAMARAEASPAVVAALGTPLDAGFWVRSEMTVGQGTGDADLVIPLSGPDGTGRLFVVAEMRSGKWVYDTLRLEVSGSNEVIDLLGE